MCVIKNSIVVCGILFVSFVALLHSLSWSDFFLHAHPVPRSHSHNQHNHMVHEHVSTVLRKGKIQSSVTEGDDESTTSHHNEPHCKFSEPGFAEKIEAKMYHSDTPRVQSDSSSSSSSAALRRKIGGAGTPNPGFQSIRITASFLDLNDPNKYCTTVGESKSDFQGSTMICTSENILTAAKRDLLVNVIIPYAIAKLQSVLLVNRFNSPLQVPSRDICDGGFTVPAAFVSPGAPNADYVLLVAGGPDNDNVIAWAGGCAMTNDVPVPRVAIGRANFNPKFLDVTTTPLVLSLRTALHELIHAFGFTHTYLTYAGLVRDVTIRGRNFRGIVSPLALQTARNYFGCQSLVAVELEDEGGSGTVNSHLNRRSYKNSIMAGTGGTTLSVVELAILNDIGVYKVNYTHADPIFFGRGAGCNFSETTCPATINGAGASARYVFCNAATPSVGCTSNLEGYGPCTTTAFLTDTCRYYLQYSDANCIDPAQGNLSNFGESYHADSRCYDTGGGFKKTGTAALSFSTRCIQSRCSFVANSTTDAIQVEFRVGSMDTWMLCTSDNAVISVPGYDGVVKCPSNLKEMCASVMTTGRKVPTDNETAEEELFLKSALKANAVPDFLVTSWTVYPGHLTTATLTSAGSLQVGVVLAINIFFVFLFIVM